MLIRVVRWLSRGPEWVCVRPMEGTMRFLVTGATGFIGGHLCERLVGDGHTVVALVRTPEKASRLQDLGVTLLHGDLSLFADPACSLPEVDVVVHLAGVVTAPTESHYEAINFDAVVDLMGCIRRQSWTPRRLLFASSLAAAGPSPAGRPWTEEDAPIPIEPYGEAKARAEAALARAHYPVTSFRPPVVFGPGDPAFLTLFKAASRGLGLRVTGTPQRLSWVGVDDLVSAIVAMAGDERPGHFTYFTTSEDVIDVHRLWDAIAASVGREIFVVPVPGAALSVAAAISTWVSRLLGFANQLDGKKVTQMRAPSFVCTSAALTGDLGWTARVPFEEAIQRTADGYRAAGWI